MESLYEVRIGGPQPAERQRACAHHSKLIMRALRTIIIHLLCVKLLILALNAQHAQIQIMLLLLIYYYYYYYYYTFIYEFIDFV